MARDTFRTMRRKAERKGWTRPGNPVAPGSNLRAAWLRYWQACEDYERHPERGRPIPPHRSG